MLRVLLAVAEEGAAAHLDVLLPAMSAACNEAGDEVFTDMVYGSAQLLGHFVPPDALLAALLPRARGQLEGMDTAQHRGSALTLLAAVVNGMRPVQLGAHLTAVAAALCDGGLRRAVDGGLRAQLLSCTLEVVDAAAGEDAEAEEEEDGTAAAAAAAAAAVGEGNVLVGRPQAVRLLMWALLQLAGSAPAGSEAQVQALQGLATLARAAAAGSGGQSSSHALCARHLPHLLRRVLPTSDGDRAVEAAAEAAADKTAVAAAGGDAAAAAADAASVDALFAGSPPPAYPWAADSAATAVWGAIVRFGGPGAGACAARLVAPFLAHASSEKLPPQVLTY